MRVIPYGKQHITERDVAAVVAALQSDFLTQGPRIDEFETNFAHYVGSQYAVAVSNGTAALHLCTLALGVSTGSRVITTPNTFAASANCVRYCGGEVAFVDVDPETALIDLDKVEDLLRGHPRGTFDGIVPVDFAGYPVNLEVVRRLADEFGLWIIEDACHAPGGFFTDSTGNRQFCGSGKLADLAIFSFHPVKHIASGEGGMITTDRQDLYERLLMLRTHGITKNPDLMQENHGGWYYEMQELGYNYRIPDVLAALGNSQLARADEGLARRRELARQYDAAFAGTSVRTLTSASDGGHAYHLYVVLVKDRKKVYDYLRSHQIFAQVHYIPVHTLPYYLSLGYETGSLPLAEDYYAHCLSLPMFPTLADEEQAFVIEKILEVA